MCLVVKKKIIIIPYIFLGVYFYTPFSTIFIVFMICFILINFKGVKKKINKRKKSERKNTIHSYFYDMSDFGSEGCGIDSHCGHLFLFFKNLK